jgi:hypothetical protein
MQQHKEPHQRLLFTQPRTLPCPTTRAEACARGRPKKALNARMISTRPRAKLFFAILPAGDGWGDGSVRHEGGCVGASGGSFLRRRRIVIFVPLAASARAPGSWLEVFGWAWASRLAAAHEISLAKLRASLLLPPVVGRFRRRRVREPSRLSRLLSAPRIGDVGGLWLARTARLGATCECLCVRMGCSGSPGTA